MDREEIKKRKDTKLIQQEHFMEGGFCVQFDGISTVQATGECFILNYVDTTITLDIPDALFECFSTSANR